MGISAGTQAMMNKGDVNVFATILDGVTAPGTSTLVGNIWSPSVNVVTGDVSNEYIGNGISADEYFVRTSTGLVFGAKQKGLETFGGKSVNPYTQFSSGIGSQGISNAYEKK